KAQGILHEPKTNGSCAAIVKAVSAEHQEQVCRVVIKSGVGVGNFRLVGRGAARELPGTDVQSVLGAGAENGGIAARAGGRIGDEHLGDRGRTGVDREEHAPVLASNRGIFGGVAVEFERAVDDACQGAFGGKSAQESKKKQRFTKDKIHGETITPEQSSRHEGTYGLTLPKNYWAHGTSGVDTQ